MPSVKHIFLKLASLKVRDFVYLHIFEGFKLPHEYSTVWPWSQTTLCRYLKKIGFAYEDKTYFMSTQNKSRYCQYERRLL